MRQIADFHIHSKYSRACSPRLTLENIEATCRVKGIDIIGTGDFTYPAWFSSIQADLEEIASSGLYKHKGARDDKIKFILTTELALIYKDDVRCRRVHMVLHAPNRAAVLELNKFLDKNYNIRSDGRPILGMSCPDLVKLCLKIHPDFLIYPAHIWTPWFSVFGSKSGFNSLEECFRDQTEHIRAYETGLSSDPEMNWRFSELDNLTLLSNSDAHSPANLAREANVFELEEISYNSIQNVIKSKANAKNKLVSTIEFYPEEGMYHIDGHRACAFSCAPIETKKYKGICPKCKKTLTIGVENRVEELADRPLGFKPKNKPGFKKLVELDKIIAESLGIKSRNSKKVQAEYKNIIEKAGTELDILLHIPLDELAEITEPLIVEGIKRVRAGKLIVKPGFDGQYGQVKIFKDEEREDKKQMSFFS